MVQTKCKACGKEIREGARFCKYCGAVQAEQETDQCGASKPTEDKTEKQKKRTLITFAAVVLALLLVVGGLVGYIVWDHASQPGNSDLNRFEKEEEEESKPDEEEEEAEPDEEAQPEPVTTPEAQPEETPDVPGESSVVTMDSLRQTGSALDSYKALYGAFLGRQGTDFSMDVQGIGLMDTNRDGSPDLVLVRGEFEPYAEIYTVNSSGAVKLALSYIDLGWGRADFGGTGSFGALRCYNGTTYAYGGYEGDGFLGSLTKISSDFGTTIVLSSDSYDDYIASIVEMQNTQTLEAACVFVELESYGEKDLAIELQAVEYYDRVPLNPTSTSSGGGSYSTDDEDGWTMVVKADYAALCDDPECTEVLTMIPKGTQVTVYEYVNSRVYYASYNGMTGYIADNQLGN